MSVEAIELLATENCGFLDNILRERTRTHARYFEVSRKYCEVAGSASLRQLATCLTYQLTQGCGNDQCRNTVCYTGRKNVSSAPVRRHTARSAWIIALSLLPKGHLDDKICADRDIIRSLPEDDTSPQDPASLTQRISDAVIMKQFKSSLSAKTFDLPTHSSNTTPLIGSLQSLLSTLREAPFVEDGRPNPLFISSHTAVLETVGVITYIMLQARAANPKQNLDSFETSLERALMCVTGPAQARLFPNFHRRTVGLVEELSRTLVYRNSLSRTLKKMGWAETPSYHDLLQDRLKELMPVVEACRMSLPLALLIQTLKHVFIESWDGSFVLKRSETAHGALQLANTLLKQALPAGASVSPLADVMQRPDRISLAISWLDHNRADEQTSHILDFGVMFSAGLLKQIFVTINHIKMRTAVAEASAPYVHSRDRLSELNAPWEIRSSYRREQSRQTFLLLRVRRTHLLEDSFDQLWQRRASELLNPLRIRLVEMDDMAMGQDMGGVQLEFFDLVIKEIMKEESGFFTTNESGLAYFRPGSLQPLHLFEYVGLLFGLALYNGIAIPVSLPIVLYDYMLARSMGEEDTVPLNIGDRWRSESASVGKIVAGDVTGWDVPFEYNFEANGVHLSISGQAVNAAGLSVVKSKNVTLSISGIHVKGVVPNVADVENLQWPGWQFESEPEAEDRLIDEDNKYEYVRGYAKWLCLVSVMPQLNAYLKGFNTIIENETLRELHHGQSLQELIEGYTTIDTAQLKATTSYEVFEEDEAYIEMFWTILESWSSEKLKTLVRFVTAIERIPASGHLAWKITRNESATSDSLPTSSTCFSTLYLPVYSGKAMLEEKLTTAIELGNYGFGVG